VAVSTEPQIMPLKLERVNTASMYGMCFPISIATFLPTICISKDRVSY